MKNLSRPLSLLAATALSATTLVACGSGAETAKNADGAVVVDFWHSSSGAAGETLQKLVDEFNQQHQGEIEVQASYQGSYEDSISKFIASVQTGDLPTLLQANDVQTRYMRDSGVAESASELAKKDDSYDFDNIVPGVANYYTMEDEIYSMPAMVSQPALFVNNDLLAQAGVDPNSLDTTEGLLNAIGQVRERTGKPGLTMTHSGWWMEQSAAALGKEFCSPDNGVGGDPATEFNLTDGDLVGYWDRISKLYADGAIHNPGTDSSASTGAFLAGEVAIQMNSSSGYGNVEQANVPFQWSVHRMPRDTAEAGAAPGGNSLWAIKEGHSDEEQEAAWEFMKFIGSDEAQTQIFEETGYLPTTTTAAEKLTGLTPQHESLLDQLATTPVNTVSAGCHSGALNDARTSYSQAMATIANGQDARAALETAKEGADASIASYNERAGR